MTQETITQETESTPDSMTFDSLGLSEPLLRAIRDKGYDTPSPSYNFV